VAYFSKYSLVAGDQSTQKAFTFTANLIVMRKKRSPEVATFLKNLGANIKKIRLAKSLTLTELATRCEMDISYLSKIEQGKQDIRLLTASHIATGLKIDIAVLFDF
jgi:DNA-binding Xre family transcriptional regulator